MTYVLVVLQQQGIIKEKKKYNFSILRLHFNGAKELISVSVYAGLSGNLPSIAFPERCEPPNQVILVKLKS